MAFASSKMIDALLLRRVRGSNTILLCDWFEGPLIPRKAKDRNVTRLDRLGVD